VAVLLICSVAAVVVVNGWTDAPGALTTVVCSGTLPLRRALGLAALCNALGAAAGGLLLPRVAAAMEGLARFPGLGGRAAMGLLCWVLWSVSLWGAAAWVLAVPTSESHALLAALGGAALAVGGTPGGAGAWAGAAAGLAVSAGLGWGLGQWLTPRRAAPVPAGGLARRQVCWAGGLALLHGAQDGQKYSAMLCAAGLEAGKTGRVWAVLLCAAAMALGSAVGGGRILKAVGREMAPLDGHAALCSDRAAGLTLALCTLLGLPVSTGTVKVCAAAGAGHRRGVLRGRVFGRMWLGWLATFPVCLGLGWLGGWLCLAVLA